MPHGTHDLFIIIIIIIMGPFRAHDEPRGASGQHRHQLLARPLQKATSMPFAVGISRHEPSNLIIIIIIMMIIFIIIFGPFQGPQGAPSGP